MTMADNNPVATSFANLILAGQLLEAGNQPAAFAVLFPPATSSSAIVGGQIVTTTTQAPTPLAALAASPGAMALFNQRYAPLLDATTFAAWWTMQGSIGNLTGPQVTEILAAGLPLTPDPNMRAAAMLSLL
jgi:hypothetical protein